VTFYAAWELETACRKNQLARDHVASGAWLRETSKIGFACRNFVSIFLELKTNSNGRDRVDGLNLVNRIVIRRPVSLGARRRNASITSAERRLTVTAATIFETRFLLP
jgi:hypothetical protein